jgi:hypothetical protein
MMQSIEAGWFRAGIFLVYKEQGPTGYRLKVCGMSLDVQQGSEPRDRTAAQVRSTGRALWPFRNRSASVDPNNIRDSRFTTQFATLTSLKNFLLAQGVRVRDEDAPLLSFGELNHLRYDEKGRLPTVDEWEQLDKRSLKLFSYLDDGLRKQFELDQAANLIAGLPVVFIVLALVSLGFAIFLVDRTVLLLCYFFWTAFLGAIGAIAFLSMNALSIQKDATFDLANQSLLAVRIVLGALFGVVLSIPFGFYSFITFCDSIRGTPALGVAKFSLEGALLLLPFVLGFSTSLVILVLNNFVESITVFFGGGRGSR